MQPEQSRLEASEKMVAERLENIILRLQHASKVIDDNPQAELLCNNKDVCEASAELVRLVDPAIDFLQAYQLHRNNKRLQCLICGWTVRANPLEPRSSCGCKVLHDIAEMKKARELADKKRLLFASLTFLAALILVFIQMTGCAAQREREWDEARAAEAQDRLMDPDRCPIESPLVDPAYRAGFLGDRSVDPQVQLSEAYRYGAYYRTHDLLWRDGWRALEASRSWSKEQLRLEWVRQNQLERMK